MAHFRILKVIVVALLILGLGVPGFAQITKSNVLLIVNTASSDSTAIRDAYRAKYGSDVLSWEYSGTTSGTIDRATFNSQIRMPLQNYLNGNNAPDGTVLAQKIIVLVTTKGVPLRIDDDTSPGAGDNAETANNEYTNGLYTASSVDSELVLLQQNLQAGTDPFNTPCYANNFIKNPYYGSPNRIDGYSRTRIARTFSFVFSTWQVYGYTVLGWQNSSNNPALTPGRMYLVTRLSGYTAQEAIAALNRGGAIPVNKSHTTVVLDRSLPALDGTIFPNTRAILQDQNGFNVLYDETSAFITAAPLPVIAYAGYGVNHSPLPPSGRFYILSDLTFTLARGAIFNTYESWNGRGWDATNPLDPAQHDSAQGQLADWIHIGGTLGLGHVWEPLTIGIADTSILYPRMLVNGWTFVEAAYASLPILSWQNIVVGDPLATFNVGDLEIAASLDDPWNWVYQNTSGTLANNGGHARTLTVAITNNTFGDTSYTMTVTQTPVAGGGAYGVGSGGAVTVLNDPGGNPLVKIIQGSLRSDGLAGVGDCLLHLVVTGNTGSTVSTDLTITVRRLGDIDGDGYVTVADRDLLNSRLNALDVGGRPDRAFDLDHDGNITGAERVMLNMIFGGLPVP